MIALENKLATHPWHGVLASANLPLVIVVLLAAAARVGWLLISGDAFSFSTEELEYLRIAENLVAGNGYVGLYGTAQTVHTPLYPAAVAALGSLLHNVPLAGIIVSVTAGALLPIPVYYLARHLYGQRVALVAAILVAFLPYLVWLSTDTYSEPLFLTLLVTTLLFAVLALDLRHATFALLAGIFLGLAYLDRPTGMYLLPVTILFLVGVGLTRRSRPARIAAHVALIVVAFLVMAAPYVAFLHRSTGYLLLDGKSAGLRAMSLAMYRGATYSEAARGINDDLSQTGFELDQTSFTIGLLQSDGERADLGQWLRETALHTPQNSRPIARSLLMMTSPLVVVLCLIGIFRLVEATPERPGKLFVLVAFGLLLAIQVALPWFLKRFAAPLMVFVLLYAAVGLDWMVVEIRQLLQERLPGKHVISRYLVPGVATVMVLMSTIPSVASLVDADNQACYANARSAGHWLREQGTADLRLMDRSMEVTFHSGGTALMPPYTDADTALRYVAWHQPTHIVVFEPYCRQTPYLCTWLDSGIADERARLVLELPAPTGCRLKLYEWK